jgi:hypothetical protein
MVVEESLQAVQGEPEPEVGVWVVAIVVQVSDGVCEVGVLGRW